MKVKVLKRNPQDYVRDRASDIQKVPRNLDPSLHPMEGPREYTRALNAAKLERVFAKPFLGALSGHTDGVYCMAKHPGRLSTMVSGSCDGVVKVWDLSRLDCVGTCHAHSGFVRGVCVDSTGERFISVGEDKNVKIWSLDPRTLSSDPVQPLNTAMSKGVLLGIGHSYSDATFATCGDTVDIWDHDRLEPVRSFNWGVDSIQSVRFNPVETRIISTTASDRTVSLYDIRMSTPLCKVVMTMRPNTTCWNPMEALNFVVANDDSNLYTFDMRNLSEPLNVHMDHLAAVLDVDYSPTGQEFVSCSFDKTIRIFKFNSGHSREVYHTKRMQRIFSVKWSNDGHYIVSGSDEMNIRLWKAESAHKVGPLLPREKSALFYSKKLRSKFKHHPQVRRVLRHRHVPKAIYQQSKVRRVMLDSRRRKLENVILNSKPGTVKRISERKKHIVSVLE